MQESENSRLSYTCDKCPTDFKSFKSLSLLQHHKWSFHSGVLLKCERNGCSKKGFLFKNLQTLRNHQKICGVKTVAHFCRYCKRPFSFKRNASEHEKICDMAVRSISLKCEVPNCGIKFLTKFGLTRHLERDHWIQRKAKLYMEEIKKSSQSTTGGNSDSSTNESQCLIDEGGQIELSNPNTSSPSSPITQEPNVDPVNEEIMEADNFDDFGVEPSLEDLQISTPKNQSIIHDPTGQEMHDDVTSGQDYPASLQQTCLVQIESQPTSDIESANEEEQFQPSDTDSLVPPLDEDDKPPERVWMPGCPWTIREPVSPSIQPFCRNEYETLKLFSELDSYKYWNLCKTNTASPLNSVAVVKVYEATPSEMKDFPSLMRKLYGLGYHHGGVFHIRTPKEYQDWVKPFAVMKDKTVVPKFQIIEKTCNPRAGKLNTLLYRKMKVSDFRRAAKQEWNAMPAEWKGQEEKRFWDSFIERLAFYAYDEGEGSLSPPIEECSYFNVRKLGEDFSALIGEEIEGVTTPFGYFGSFGSVFGVHVEDGNLASVNLHVKGKPKSWYCIPTVFHDKMHSLMKNLYLDEDKDGCFDFLRHKDFLPHPDLLAENGIPVFHAKQLEGDLIVTIPLAYHFGWNHGENHNESLNFADDVWVEFAKHATFCSCRRDSVRLLLDGPMKKYQPELYEIWKDGSLSSQIPFSNDLNFYRVLNDTLRKEQDEYFWETIPKSTSADCEANDKQGYLAATKLFFRHPRPKPRNLGQNNMTKTFHKTDADKQASFCPTRVSARILSRKKSQPTKDLLL